MVRKFSYHKKKRLEDISNEHLVRCRSIQNKLKKATFEFETQIKIKIQDPNTLRDLWKKKISF